MAKQEIYVVPFLDLDGKTFWINRDHVACVSTTPEAGTRIHIGETGWFMSTTESMDEVITKLQALKT